MYFIPLSGSKHTILLFFLIFFIVNRLLATHKTLPDEPPIKTPSVLAIFLDVEKAFISLHFTSISTSDEI